MSGCKFKPQEYFEDDKLDEKNYLFKEIIIASTDLCPDKRPSADEIYSKLKSNIL